MVLQNIAAVLTATPCFNSGWWCGVNIRCPRASIDAIALLAAPTSHASPRKVNSRSFGITSIKAEAERPKLEVDSCERVLKLEATEKIPGLHSKRSTQMTNDMDDRIKNDSQDNPRRLFVMSSLISTLNLGMSILAGSSESRFELSKILLRARRRYLLL